MKMKKILRLPHLLSTFALGLSLSIDSGYGQVPITVNHLPVDQLNISDIDFQTGGSSRYYFSVSIGRSLLIDTVRLHFSVDIQLPGERFDNAISFVTAPFKIPKTFTNLDLGPNSSINIDGVVNFNDLVRSRIRDEALATGKLPAGTYRFTFELLSQLGLPIQTSGDNRIVLTLRNISRLDLISPRDGEVAPNTFPLFQWIFDGNRVELSVYERLPQHSSKEEAAQGTPHLCVVLDNVRSFQYPAANLSQACPGVVLRNLESGKKYVWRVRGLTTGSGGGGTSINSEIWEFTVASSAGTQSAVAGTGGAQQNLSGQILNIPGLDPRLLSQLSSGSLLPTGVVLVNGIPVTVGEITTILNDLAQNPDKIIDVHLVERQ
jgi:hypothetical protein